MFKKLKNDIVDWAIDTDGINQRKKLAINELNPYLDIICELWDKNSLQETYIAEILKLKTEIYFLGGNDRLISSYEKGNISKLQEKLGQGKNAQTFLLALKLELKKLNLQIKEEDIVKIAKNLENLSRLKVLIEYAKIQIYVEKAEDIYNALIVISAIQKKYMDISNIIGKPEDIDKILGVNGEKLKQSSQEALDYISKMISLSQKLKTELSFINAREISKSKRTL